MMDVYCPRCGEPWDIDSFHEEATESGRTFTEVRKDFARQGCEALAAAFGYNPECAQGSRDKFRAQASAALMDVLGDDIDGVASMLDDFGI